jgi:DNA-directed RNA polymerase specialized sigma24 family protein
LGHNSNPAPAGEQPSAPDEATPAPATTHRTQRRLRSVEIDALVDHYQAGATIAQVVERFRISRTTVMAHLDRRGIQRRAVAKRWDHKKLASTARSYADGSSLATIAAQLGLDPSTVANRFRRAAVPIRPRRGWD